MPKITEEKLWAGSEDSHARAIEADNNCMAQLKAGAITRDAEKSDDAESRLIDIYGSVGVINIRGSLNNDSDSWWNEYVGATGYPEIREALVELSNDSSIEHIVLAIDSPGGAVSGVDDTASLVSMINERVKPVVTHTSGNMASAAYWIGSAASQVFSTKGSTLGSIGVIATHKEYSEYFEKQGIKNTVLRAGKYKALASPFEKLTDAARAQIQARLDLTYDMFVEAIAGYREKSVEYVDANMADGREFHGQAAVDVGLSDGLMSIDTLVSTLEQKNVDGSIKKTYSQPQQTFRLSVHDTGDADMAGKKKILTDADIAAIAAGAPITGVSASADAGVEDEATGTPNAETETTDAQAEGADQETGEAEASSDADSSKQEPNVDSSNETIKFMSSQLDAANDKIVSLRVANDKADSKIESLNAIVEPLKLIAGRAVNNMRIALNQAPVDVETMTASQVVADHGVLAEQFANTFKAGGVSAATGNSAKEEASGVMSARARAIHNAVKTK